MYAYSARVIRWIDGDTVDLRVDLGFKLYAETRFRLYGIDTPERGQKNHGQATALVNSLAPVGADVFIHSYKDPDTYGRWLAEIVTAGGASVNTRLVEFGLAVPYLGGTKAVTV